MPHDFFNLDELAVRLGRDRREVEKLVSRGRIPGHKSDGEWRFHPTEIRHWLEQELRGYSESELANLEQQYPSPEMDDSSTPIARLMKPEMVQVPLEARTKRSALETLIELAGKTWQVWEPATVLQAVLEREDVLSTAFENGVAIPHPRNPLPLALGESIIAFGRSPGGIPFGGPKRSITDCFFLVLARDSRTHLLILARLGRLLQKPGFLDELRDQDDSASTYDFLRAADESLGAG
jgi:PTS system nitrogen regulatory IIA component